MIDRTGQVWEFFECIYRVHTLTIVVMKTLGKCVPVHHHLESWKHQALCLETGSVSIWWEPVDFLYEDCNDRRRLA